MDMAAAAKLRAMDTSNGAFNGPVDHMMRQPPSPTLSSGMRAWEAAIWELDESKRH